MFLTYSTMVIQTCDPLIKRSLARTNIFSLFLDTKTAVVDLQAMWYPTVRRTLVCLSKLYTCIGVSHTHVNKTCQPWYWRRRRIWCNIHFMNVILSSHMYEVSSEESRGMVCIFFLWIWPDLNNALANTLDF